MKKKIEIRFLFFIYFIIIVIINIFFNVSYMLFIRLQIAFSAIINYFIEFISFLNENIYYYYIKRVFEYVIKNCNARFDKDDNILE